MSDYITWMCSTSAKCNSRFLLYMSFPGDVKKGDYSVGIPHYVVFVTFARGCSFVRKIIVSCHPYTSLKALIVIIQLSV